MSNTENPSSALGLETTSKPGITAPKAEENYDTKREKAKLGGVAVCIMIFKTTIGVGIFTFPYAFCLCGVIWGSLLSALVFYMTIYGILQLIILVNRIENDLEKERIQSGNPNPAIASLKNDDSLKENKEKNFSLKKEKKKDDKQDKKDKNDKKDKKEKDIKSNKNESEQPSEFINNTQNNTVDLGGEFIDLTEDEKSDPYKISVFHQVATRSTDKGTKFFQAFTVFMSCAMNVGFALGNYVYLIHVLEEFTESPPRLISTILVFVYLILIFLVLIPEKIKFLAYIISVMIFLIIVTIQFNNYIVAFTNHGDSSEETAPNYRIWNMSESGLLIGVSLFSFESISSIINVRRTAKYQHKMARYSFITYTLSAILFLIHGIGFMLAFGDNNLKKVAFDFYSKSNVIHYFEILIAFNPLFSVTFNIIATQETFEKIRCTSKLVKDKDGKLIIKRIFIMRALLLAIIYLLTLLSTDISIVFGLVGSLFGPILGLILPVYFKMSYFRKTGRKSGLPMRVHDICFLILSFIIGIIGIAFTFMHESSENHKHKPSEGKRLLIFN